MHIILIYIIRKKKFFFYIINIEILKIQSPCPGPGQYNYVGDSFDKTLTSVNEKSIPDDNNKIKSGIIVNQNANDLTKIKDNKQTKAVKNAYNTYTKYIHFTELKYKKF